MTISKDLYLSILALDAYNRGYGPGFAGLGGAGTGVGSATILNIALPQGYQAAGFYAVVYNTPFGAVISYRGTDNLGSLPNAADVYNGYGVATGSFLGEQARMAAEFRNAVVAAGYANPILTGHSLGGGLAGFVASLYGDEAKIFDNMPFQLSAEQVFTYALLDDAYYAANPSSADQAKSHYARDTFFGGQMPSAMLPDYEPSGL